MCSYVYVCVHACVAKCACDICVYICVCMHVQVCMRHMCVYICVCKRMCVCVSVCMCKHVHMDVCTQLNVLHMHSYVWIHLCMYLYTYVCMCVCMHVCTYKCMCMCRVDIHSYKASSSYMHGNQPSWLGVQYKYYSSIQQL